MLLLIVSAFVLAVVVSVLIENRTPSEYDQACDRVNLSLRKGEGRAP